MSSFAITRSRSTASVVVGGVVTLIGLVILGNAVVATRLSVQFLGWMLVLAGVVGLLSALLNLRSGGSWISAIGGGLFLVVGVMCLRNVEAAAVTLTLMAGALFLLSGVVRLVAAVGNTEYRWALILGGAISTLLGLVVLFNLFAASYALLGVLLGIQTVAEGLSLMLLGRMSVTPVRSDPLATSA